jgi:hypothetical protein
MDGAADDRYRAMAKLAAAAATAMVISTTAVLAMGMLSFDRAPPPAVSVATATTVAPSGLPIVGHVR